MVMRTLMLLLLVIGMDGDEWEEQNLWSSLDSTLAMKCSLPKILHTVHTRVQPQRNMNMENLPCSRFWGGFTVLFSWVTTTFESPSLIASGSKATIETVSCEHGRTEHISIGTSKRNFICWILNQQKIRQTMLFLVTYSLCISYSIKQYKDWWHLICIDQFFLMNSASYGTIMRYHQSWAWNDACLSNEATIAAYHHITGFVFFGCFGKITRFPFVGGRGCLHSIHDYNGTCRTWWCVRKQLYRFLCE